MHTVDMPRRNRYDLESEAQIRRQVVAAAEAVLRGDIGVIEGSRRLSTLAFDVVDDWRLDPDFVVFGAIDSETDHLPVGTARDLWDPAALVEKDALVRRMEDQVRASMEAACRNILLRFRDA